jgi:predicted DNA binding protein
MISARIASLKRKDRLLTDTTIELNFETSDPGLFFIRITDFLDCSFILETVTRQSSEALNINCRLDVDSIESVRKLPDHIAAIETVELINQDSEMALFKIGINVRDTMILEMVTENGGVLREAVAEAGEGRFVVDIPVATTTRLFVEMISEQFPDTELVAKQGPQERTRHGQTFEQIGKANLTDRQREVLERAYASGYFETPRRQTGTEIAESLGISQSAFNQTIRRAHRNLLSVFFADSYDITQQ